MVVHMRMASICMARAWGYQGLQFSSRPLNLDLEPAALLCSFIGMQEGGGTIINGTSSLRFCWV